MKINDDEFQLIQEDMNDRRYHSYYADMDKDDWNAFFRKTFWVNILKIVLLPITIPALIILFVVKMIVFTLTYIIVILSFAFDYMNSIIKPLSTLQFHVQRDIKRVIRKGGK